MLPTLPSSHDDQLALVRSIQQTFERSSVFRDAHISEPHAGPDGDVSVEVGFGSSPALFRVVARCPARAYAILYELAASLVDVECGRIGMPEKRGKDGKNGTAEGGPHPEPEGA